MLNLTKIPSVKLNHFFSIEYFPIISTLPWASRYSRTALSIIIDTIVHVIYLKSDGAWRPSERRNAR